MAYGVRRDITDRLKAAMAYLITGGSTEKAAQLTGIPGRTIRDWTYEESWADLIAEAKKNKQAELDSMFTAIVHSATENVLDRLQNGDVVIQKDGSTIRKPMSGREAALVAAIIYDKRALQRGEATRRTESVSTDKRLEEIKKGLSGIAADDEREFFKEPKNPSDIADIKH